MYDAKRKNWIQPEPKWGFIVKTVQEYFPELKYGKLETPAIISNENPVRVKHYTKKSSGYTQDQEFDIVPTDILRNLGTTNCGVQRHTYLLYFVFLMLINAYISTMSTVLSLIYDA